MLRIWGRRSAFNVQKAMWCIGELGLEHSHIDAGGSFGGLDTPEFLAMNPHGAIPVIDDGGSIVWESHTILRYLAARYGDDALFPADPAARSHVDRWLDWALATQGPAFMQLFWGYFRTPENQRNDGLVQATRRTCGHLYRLLDRELASRDYLAGDHFTIADIPAGTTLYRYFEMGLETPELPHVTAWYARLRERPAYREHIMIPFEELRGRLQF